MDSKTEEDIKDELGDLYKKKAICGWSQKDVDRKNSLESLLEKAVK